MPSARKVAGWVLVGLWASGAALAEAPLLGTPLRLEGFSLRPPAGFRMGRISLYQGTRAGAVTTAPGRPRFLAGALMDGEGQDAAALLVAVVDAPFEATPSARDAFATAAVRHFADELGLSLGLERVELVRGPPARVEVVATTRQNGQVRYLLVSAIEGAPRHLVITFSVPSGRFEALAPALRASLETVRLEVAGPRTLPRGLVAALGLSIALALLMSWSMWRRRKRMERADRGLPG